jgi:AraC family transcriptional regulator of adaptative response/methylated-DNA-[protein]-cysteine methyltransferase
VVIGGRPHHLACNGQDLSERKEAIMAEATHAFSFTSRASAPVHDENAVELRFATGTCFLGHILVAESGKGICAILFGDNSGTMVRDLQDRFPQAKLSGGDKGRLDDVIRFVEDPASAPDFPLDPQGTAFQQQVWTALQEIPAGKTASYLDVAKRIGAPEAVRAVAQACSANPIAVAIPCHRVVRSDGGLSGYRWGGDRKRRLLNKEAVL